MSIILNFNLPTVVTGVSRILCLPDAGDGSTISAFQTTTQFLSGALPTPPANLIRNDSLVSSGFPFSITTPVPVPENAYTINLPSSAYGVSPTLNTFSVLQVNAEVAKLEPGFSRIEVTYSYGATGIGTAYFDVPFHEGWNVTEREMNNVVDYLEDGFNFAINQVNLLQLTLNYFQLKEFWRGISVSGQVSFTPATIGLEQGMLK